MAQLTIYLPDDVEKRIRREAKRAHTSVSAYIARLASPPASRGKWPKDFLRLKGSCSIAAADDLPAEPVDPL